MTVNAITDTKRENRDCAYLSSYYPRPISEYFANDPECHDLLPCALRSHRVPELEGCPTGPPVGGVTSTLTSALWPCAVLWPCTFCSDRCTAWVKPKNRPGRARKNCPRYHCS